MPQTFLSSLADPWNEDQSLSSFEPNDDAIVHNTIGIVGMSVYIPKSYVEQSELEKFDQVKSGKYTIGLGQQRMAFAEESEDVISMMLTATNDLLTKTGINPEQVGRLEVGTETLVDKSKATKTSLMRLFGDATDIEGVDTINACYGGTNALFNALQWLSNPGWDGRYAIVVTGDIAIYERGPARPTGGAGVVAFLLGPDAPVALPLTSPRASHFEDAYDFYKPNLTSEYPIVDGHLSNVCYLRAVDKCFERFAQKSIKLRGTFDIRQYDHILFHQPYAKLVKKSYARLLWNQHKLSGNIDKSLDKYLNLSTEETYVNKDLEKDCLNLAQDYEKCVYPSTFLGREVGNMYTGSLYGSLASIIAQYGASLIDQKALLFSYGSGLAATMFETKFRGNANGVLSKNRQHKNDLEELKSMIDLDGILKSRIEISPEEYTNILERRKQTYGKFPIQVPEPKIVRPGTFYLSSVDNLGRRQYARSFSTRRMSTFNIIHNNNNNNIKIKNRILSSSGRLLRLSLRRGH